MSEFKRLCKYSRLHPSCPYYSCRYGAQYAELISYQDFEGNIGKTFDSLCGDIITPDSHVVELGAGSGRLGAMLSARCKSVHFLDNSPAMLRMAAKMMETEGITNCRFDVAGMAHLGRWRGAVTLWMKRFDANQC